MGKGIIQSNLGDGLYTVKLDYETTVLDQRLQKLNDRKTELEAVLLQKRAALVDLRADVDSKQYVVNQLIEAWIEELRNPSG